MNRFLLTLLFSISVLITFQCSPKVSAPDEVIPLGTDITMDQKSSTEALNINRYDYANGLEGFWLGQCIANWTGLITEMDKIGNIGEVQTGEFYTRDNWGGPDEPNIWSKDDTTEHNVIIDFVLRSKDEIWGADDDTDIEYMYQYLLHSQKATSLTPEMIRNGWLKHIKAEEENYLWVSNQKAFDLMYDGIIPPETSNPELNEHYEMIDAQLTTEIFGLFAPAHPMKAMEIAHNPIMTVARENASYISEFHVALHSLASTWDKTTPIQTHLAWMMEESSELTLPKESYAAKMYSYVKAKYESGIPWEAARDSIYVRYQVNGEDGYHITDQNLYCNGCFAAGINFAAGLVSLWYGQGDFKETIKIGSLMGWDSDNPTATWGGLLGFMHGGTTIKDLFDIELSEQYNIHRTRQNFPNNGINTFREMAIMGVQITDRVIAESIQGSYNPQTDSWIIPNNY